MALVLKDRIKETTTATVFGTGNPTLAGAVSGFRSFADVGNGNTTYYTIVGGTQWEVGIGTYTASGTTLSRDTVLSNSLGTTAKINFTAGVKDVFVTSPSATALLGRGGSFLPSNLAIGAGAIDSNLITTSNTDLIAVGNNTLPSVGKGVATLNITSAGSGYLEDDGGGGTTDNFTASGQMVYLSGTPVMAGGTYPTVSVTVSGGVVTGVAVINTGSGFPTTVTDTLFNVVLDGNITFTEEAVFNPITYSNASNIIAIGNNAGSTSRTNNNSIYIGNNVTGIGISNEIVIGNSSNLTTAISGVLTTGGITCGASTIGTSGNVVIGHNGANGLTNAITIGGTAGRGSITLGQSTNTTQVVNISSGATISGTKTLNIANGATGGTTLVNIANISGASQVTIASGSGTNTVTLSSTTATQTVNIATGNTGLGVTKTVNIGTGASGASSNTNIAIGQTSGIGTVTIAPSVNTQTVNIATGATVASTTKAVNIGTAGLASSTTTITVGSTAGASTTTLNGTVRVQTYTVANLPTGIAGSRSFVTDASTPVFGMQVVGGGSPAVNVPVYHDGTVWRVG